MARIGPSSTQVDEKGAAAVEFAVILSALMAVLFAIIYSGLALSQWIVLTGAAREGARCAAVRSDCDVRDTVDIAARPYVVDESTFVVNNECDDTSEEQDQSVTVSWTQEVTVDIFIKSIPWDLPIQAVFRCE